MNIVIGILLPLYIISLILESIWLYSTLSKYFYELLLWNTEVKTYLLIYTKPKEFKYEALMVLIDYSIYFCRNIVKENKYLNKVP